MAEGIHCVVGGIHQKSGSSKAASAFDEWGGQDEGMEGGEYVWVVVQNAMACHSHHSAAAVMLDAVASTCPA